MTKLDYGRRVPSSLSTSGSVDVPRYFTLKRWPTRIVGAVLLVAAAPLMLILAALVRSTSAGPWLFRQRRTGLHGKEFTMFKIRTMYVDAESVSGPTWCVPGDSRITPVGKMLRFLHLDELPQLINIVRGEMDLIGPRPERPCFVAWLCREVPNYAERLSILPGVTGLAQVNLPPDESVDSVRKKLALDSQYIRAAGLSLDIRILMCTCLRMFGIRHGRAARWLGVKRHVDFPREIRHEPIAAVRQLATAAATRLSIDGPFSHNGINGAAVLSAGDDGEDEGLAADIEVSMLSAAALPRLPR